MVRFLHQNLNTISHTYFTRNMCQRPYRGCGYGETDVKSKMMMMIVISYEMTKH